MREGTRILFGPLAEQAISQFHVDKAILGVSAISLTEGLTNDVRIGQAGVHVLADPTLGLRVGQNVTLDFNTHKVQFFAPETEQSLLWA